MVPELAEHRVPTAPVTKLAFTLLSNWSRFSPHFPPLLSRGFLSLVYTRFFVRLLSLFRQCFSRDDVDAF